MSPLSALTDRLSARLDLAAGEAEIAAAELAAPEVAEAAKAAFLMALTAKGETAEEVAAFARAFRARAVDPGVGEWSARAIDIVGTGGDHSGGFNISSLVVLILASAGMIVMKHGNRGITSRSGSADLLESLGIRIDPTPAVARGALAELGFVFFFAPAYHPAFKHIAPVRKALAARGQRTIFNILGPLTNPGRPAQILLGVFAGSWVKRLAAALDELGTDAGLVVHGEIAPGQGIDELTTATRNQVAGIGRLRSVNAEWTAADFGLPAAPFRDLQGGDLAANLALTEAILSGRGPAGLVDTIVLNAAAGLWIGGRTASIPEGLAPARELLLGGAARRKLAAARDYFGGAA
jgi:anthranilate phosphoribosyltransferase